MQPRHLPKLDFTHKRLQSMTAKIATNEREFTGQVVSWLNELLDHGAYPFREITGETTIHTGKKKLRFPDVQLWLNRKAGLAFCGWECKPPTVAVDDSELLGNAAEKARAIRADFFVTWNMRDTVIWRTPPVGQNVTHTHRYYAYGSLTDIREIEDLWDEACHAQLRERAAQILRDMAILHREGHLNLEPVSKLL
ncbi:MAG: hypothetical protein AB1644_04190 [Candidatus Zixiibacteriota bacterium]